jgi:NADH:ubiquinone oxidoreductase subunit 5 (subunit L)/multisubunit Na+/H+ antiporter MnhA subunit
MPNTLLVEVLAYLIFLPVIAAFLWLAGSMLLSRRPPEKSVVRNCHLALGTAFFASLLLAVAQPFDIGTEAVLGSWFVIGGYHYDIVMQTDLIAVTYALFSTLLLFLICSFSQRYLHKESGFHRFYLALLIFATGLLLVSFAGTLELLLVGWEIVGLSSIMLIAFFTTRPQPAQNGLWVFSIYRLTDIGLYAAILYLHSHSQATRLTPLDSVTWSGIGLHEGTQVTAFLLLIAVLGKSALFPFSSWLPRAMEGPTPSSAVFYGALSVHLGPLLLLRMADLISATPALSATLIAVGALTALVANLSVRVQSDIKSRLAFSAVGQLGFITIEIGLGWFELALLHVVAHAVFRTLQFLRAPSLLHDRHQHEALLGHHLSVEHQDHESTALRRFVFRLSLERAFLDILLVDRIARPVLAFARAIDRAERSAANFVCKDS